jgi:hypothetical protein
MTTPFWVSVVDLGIVVRVRVSLRARGDKATVSL